MPIVYPADGPLQQIQDRLWTLLETSTQIALLLPKAGRVKFDDPEFPDPSDGSVESLPRLVIEPGGWRREPPDGADLRYVQIWRFVLLSADRRTKLTHRLKMLIAGVLELAGADLGLGFVESWSLSRGQEEPDSSDRTRRINPRRSSDRRAVAGDGRRVLAELAVTLRPELADLSAWIGSVAEPAATRLRLWLAGAAVGSELLSLDCRATALGAFALRFRVSLSAADGLALSAARRELTLLLSESCGRRPAQLTAEVRDAATDRVRAAFPDVELALPVPAKSRHHALPPSSRWGVVELVGTAHAEPVWSTGSTPISRSWAVPAEWSVTVAVPLSLSLETPAVSQSRCRVPLEWAGS